MDSAGEPNGQDCVSIGRALVLDQLKGNDSTLDELNEDHLRDFVLRLLTPVSGKKSS